MNVTDLLKKMIEIPSISENEKEVTKFVFDYLKKNNFSPRIYKNNVYCTVGKKGRTLLLNSHLDTVPPTSWTINPFKAKEINGRVYGLGSCDAKSSVAAMIDALVKLINSENELNGRIIFAATCCEEVGHKGLEKLIKKLPNFDATIIGEPTNLNICVAQKGLIYLKFLAKGKSAHASLQGENAIYKAIKDVETLRKMKFKKRHNLLGLPTVHVTMMNAGIKKNIIPDKCEFIADIRSTPIYPNNVLIKLIKRSMKSNIEILSNRIFPKEVDDKEKIVQVARLANKNAKITGFFGVSDFVFIDRPGIIMGPGNSKQAHTANEFVKISQLKKASIVYKKTIENFFI